MTRFPEEPPRTKKELFDRILEVVRGGPYEMPTTPYSGTGAPGRYLEDLLGLQAGNQDIPDSVGWEVKYYTSKTNLVTLFHKEPKPEGIMRYMVRKHGIKDSQGRLSFRHTIAGKSERFKVHYDAGQIIVRPLNRRNGPVPFWDEDTILSAAGGKLRRLMLVRGSRHGQTVKYDRVDCFEDLQISFFIFEVVRGTVRVDFDARESKPGSDGLRNHGTKFRVAPDHVCWLYAKKHRLI